MGVKNYQQYTVTAHAKERILTRFNITNDEFDKWMTRLLSQCTYVETQDHNRMKYRLNDIVLAVDTKQKVVVTVYSENAHDDIQINGHTNPEIKSIIDEALTDYTNKKRVELAQKVHDDLSQALKANEKMLNKNTNYRFSNNAWDEFLKSFKQAQMTLDKGISLLEEAQNKMAEK